MGLSESSALDVAIGLSFVFFVLAVFAMAINEAISTATKLRAKTLEKWLEQNLANPGAVEADISTAKETVVKFYEHPDVNGLTLNRSGQAVKPSYIPSQHAITALLDVGHGIATGAAESWKLGTIAVDEITSAIDALPNSPIKHALDSAWLQAGRDVQEFRVGAEMWFDDAMDRLSGFYKRRVQLILGGIGLGLAIIVSYRAMKANLERLKERYLVGGASLQALVAIAEDLMESEHAAWIDRMAKTIRPAPSSPPQAGSS